MLKKRLVYSIVVIATLFMTGCSDSEGESQLETQQMLDNKNYNGVISKLESGADSESDYMALASAYMGKAGFSTSSLITKLTDSGDSNDDAFVAFIQSATDSSDEDPLKNLKKSSFYYEKIVDNVRCKDDNATLSAFERDICLYTGLSKVSQTAIAISYITDSVGAFGDDSGNSDNKLTASTCAMQYALDGNTSNISSDCNISNEGDVTFANGVTYGDINVTVGGKDFEYLITPSNTAVTPRSTVITKGYCTVDSFATRVDDKPNDSDYHVCPLNETGSDDEITTEKILVDALNNGIDSIGMALSDDAAESVEEFKKEVLEANGRENATDQTITTADIIKYLEDKN